MEVAEEEVKITLEKVREREKKDDDGFDGQLLPENARIIIRGGFCVSTTNDDDDDDDDDLQSDDDDDARRRQSL